jgi:hypothetical protein
MAQGTAMSAVVAEIAETLEQLRARGWAVAVHNDYRLAGEQFTFWLLTRGTTFVKGEGRTDAEALHEVAIAASAREYDERTMTQLGEWMQANVPPIHAGLSWVEGIARTVDDLRENAERFTWLSKRAQVDIYTRDRVIVWLNEAPNPTTLADVVDEARR